MLELAVNATARGLSLSLPGTLFVTSRGRIDGWSVLDVLVVLGAVAGLSRIRSPLVLLLRGGRSLRVLRLLVRRGLLELAPGDDGTPSYRTTRKFLDVFHLARIEDLPEPNAPPA
jgi:hypothetical protein